MHNQILSIKAIKKANCHIAKIWQSPDLPLDDLNIIDHYRMSNRQKMLLIIRVIKLGYLLLFVCNRVMEYKKKSKKI